jgi:hypothetical protein
MSSTTPSPSNFQLISEALSDYTKQTGIDLTKNPFVNQFQSCDSAEAISELLQDRATAFKSYRNENRKLISCLYPIFQFILVFSGTLRSGLVLVSSTEWVPFIMIINVVISGAISTCERNLSRCRCPPRSMQLLCLKLYLP